MTEDGLELYLDASNPESYAGTGNTWFDLSGGSHDATKITPAKVSYDANAGPFGNGAFSFTGTGSEGGFNIPGWATFYSAAEVTLEAWAKLRSHRETHTGIVGNYHNGNGKFNWMWGSTNGNYGFHNNGMKGSENSLAGMFSANTWYRVVLRYRSDTGVDMWVDGEQKYTRSVTGSLACDSCGSLGIGSREDGIQPMDGLISVVLAQKAEGVLKIDTWLMSCRVLKRGVENMLMNGLHALASQEGIGLIRGEYIPTAKNGLVSDHYQKLGCALVDSDEDGRTVWELAVADDWQPLTTFIEEADTQGDD